VVEYLAAKFLDSDAARHERVMARVELLSAELSLALSALKKGTV
jgi:hypothetical protein